MKNIQEFLKSCSKDNSAYTELVKFVEDLIQEKDQAKKHLDLLERAIGSDYDSILITTLDLEKPGPFIEYVNDGFTRMTGYSKEEVIGNTPRILQGPKTERAVLDNLKNRLLEGQSFFGHTVNYRKDGSEFINQWDIHPLTNEQGEITHWVSYQHDITERKRSERQVIDSQIEFDHLAEESKKTMADFDVQGNILTSNKAFRDLIGFDDDELKRRKIWELLSDRDIDIFRHKFDKFKPSDFQEKTLEVSLKNKKGSLVEVKINTRLLNIDGQKVVRAAFENKSLQKRIMSILKQRNVNLEKMFDRLKDYRYRLVQDSERKFRFKFVSDSFSEITGISADEAENMPISKLVHQDDLEAVNAHLMKVIDGKPHTEKFRIKGKNKSFITVIDYAKPVWDSQNAVVEEIKGASSTEISSVSDVKES